MASNRRQFMAGAAATLASGPSSPLHAQTKPENIIKKMLREDLDLLAKNNFSEIKNETIDNIIATAIDQYSSYADAYGDKNTSIVIPFFDNNSVIVLDCKARTIAKYTDLDLSRAKIYEELGIVPSRDDIYPIYESYRREVYIPRSASKSLSADTIYLDAERTAAVKNREARESSPGRSL